MVAEERTNGMENHRNWSPPALKLPRRDYGADEIQSAPLPVHPHCGRPLVGGYAQTAAQSAAESGTAPATLTHAKRQAYTVKHIQKDPTRMPTRNTSPRSKSSPTASRRRREAHEHSNRTPVRAYSSQSAYKHLQDKHHQHNRYTSDGVVAAYPPFVFALLFHG